MIRHHPITGDPLLLAPHRAERPNTYRDAEDRCPFCAGHEADTPPEIARAGDPWRLRAFANKYPATERHEVIVESPDHEATIIPDEAPAFYRDRYLAVAARSECVTLFKNHGVAAGASIAHMHSQLVGTPFVPPRIERESAAFASAARCPLCEPAGEVIDENEAFTWLTPDGSSMPYEQWIVPRRHAPEMREVDGLAPLLQRASRAMLRIRDSFNWMFLNFPRQPKAHWYVQLFPRIAVIAGFEIGSGSAIDIIEPAEAARTLRDYST